MIVERGNFIGHLVPASFFLGFGAFFLLLTLKRCRELQCKASKDGPSSVASFVDTHVPENPRVLRRSGVVLMICTTMGFILEAGGGLKDGKGFFYELAHEVMYGTAFFVGMACHLEADGRLCPNSHRYALSFAFLMQYLLWYEHALMLVEDPLANRVHMIQAQINLIASLVFGYSAHAPRSMFAYVASWAVMIWNATWMLTVGLTTCCVVIALRSVAAVLVLEALLIVTFIVICSACFLNPRPPSPRGDSWMANNVEDVAAGSNNSNRYKITRGSSGDENSARSETFDIC